MRPHYCYLFEEFFFPKFEIPRVLVTDGEKHFCNNYLENVIIKYSIMHKVSKPYHPQTNGQAEISTKKEWI